MMSCLSTSSPNPASRPSVSEETLESQDSVRRTPSSGCGPRHTQALSTDTENTGRLKS